MKSNLILAAMLASLCVAAPVYAANEINKSGDGIYTARMQAAQMF